MLDSDSLCIPSQPQVCRHSVLRFPGTGVISTGMHTWLHFLTTSILSHKWKPPATFSCSVAAASYPLTSFLHPDHDSARLPSVQEEHYQSELYQTYMRKSGNSFILCICVCDVCSQVWSCAWRPEKDTGCSVLSSLLFPCDRVSPWIWNEANGWEVKAVLWSPP